MNTSSKNLKSPKELFEEKRLNALMELEYQKIKQAEELLSKKLLPPKYFFNDNVIEELDTQDLKEDSTEEITPEKVQIDPYQEQFDEIKNKISQIEEIIPEEVDLTEVTNLITSLEERINSLPKLTDYSVDIEKINSEIKRIENSIPIPEIFDPSDLYQNINILKNKIGEVRAEIPTIPQPILYDEQLDELHAIVETVRNSIPTVPEVKYYDDELQSIIDSIEQVRQEIPVLPEIKYYDEQISQIENRLFEIQESIPIVPEVKYYDEDLKNIDKKFEEKVEDINILIDVIQESIPTVPEVKYYDEDVKKLQTKIEEVKNSIPTVPEVKYYDEDLKSLNKEIKELYNKISSIKVPDETVYFDKVKTLYTSFEDKNHKLLEKINYLEEVFEKFNEEKILKEDLAEPPEVKNSDPLTPLDQNYVTLDQLQQHYKLFINRVQQQLATIGGGGETQLKYLDDIVGIATNASAYDNKFLKYNHSIRKFEFVTGSGGAGSQTLDETLQLGNSSSLGMSVGVTTVTSMNVNSVANFDTNSITFSSSSPTQIYSFSASQYRSSRVQIQITQGTDYQTSDILLIHNGSMVNLIEYASISTNDYLGTFDAVISGGDVSLQVLMGSSSSTTVKVVSQTITS